MMKMGKLKKLPLKNYYFSSSWWKKNTDIQMYNTDNAGSLKQSAKYLSLPAWW